MENFQQLVVEAEITLFIPSRRLPFAAFAKGVFPFGRREPRQAFLIPFEPSLYYPHFPFCLLLLLPTGKYKIISSPLDFGL